MPSASGLYTLEDLHDDEDGKLLVPEPIQLHTPTKKLEEKLQLPKGFTVSDGLIKPTNVGSLAIAGTRVNEKEALTTLKTVVSQVMVEHEKKKALPETLQADIALIHANPIAFFDKLYPEKEIKGTPYQVFAAALSRRHLTQQFYGLQDRIRRTVETRENANLDTEFALSQEDLREDSAEGSGHVYVSKDTADTEVDRLRMRSMEVWNELNAPGQVGIFNADNLERLLGPMDESSAKMPIENIGCGLLTMLQERGLLYVEDTERLLKLYSESIRDLRVIRIQEEKRPGYRLEMPNFVDQAIDLLQQEGLPKKVRTSMYAVLEQCALSSGSENKDGVLIPGQTEKIIKVMDTNGDLYNPLAYALTYKLFVENSEHPWIQEQTKRRKEFISEAWKSTQYQFDNFAHLQQLATGLVCSANWERDPSTTKPFYVGLEVEMQPENGERGDLYNIYNLELINENFLIGSNLELGRDLLGVWEMRTANPHDRGGIKFDEQSYFVNLLDLRNATLDARLRLRSMHIHLDISSSPGFDSINGLIGNSVSTDGDRLSVYPMYGNFYSNRGHPTNELRFFSMPSYEPTGAHPALIQDCMSFFYNYSRENHDTYLTTISLDGMESRQLDRMSWQRMFYGHVCASTPNPEARLSYMMALKHPYAVRGVTFLALMNTYGMEGLCKLSRSIRSQFNTDVCQEDRGTGIEAVPFDVLESLDILLHPEKDHPELESGGISSNYNRVTAHRNVDFWNLIVSPTLRGPKYLGGDPEEQKRIILGALTYISKHEKDLYNMNDDRSPYPYEKTQRLLDILVILMTDDIAKDDLEFYDKVVSESSASGVMLDHINSILYAQFSTFNQKQKERASLIQAKIHAQVGDYTK